MGAGWYSRSAEGGAGSEDRSALGIRVVSRSPARAGAGSIERVAESSAAPAR
ncbi:hypothetical protein NG819_04385 [Pseudarthrobacter sp. Fe7]|nr:hypothetical protein NG819_04385 [Pseudarthrobacter sp. Fe7]